ncbi:MAG: hypothetical protein Q9218_003244 [Villophora microphyllina]
MVPIDPSRRIIGVVVTFAVPIFLFASHSPPGQSTIETLEHRESRQYSDSSKTAPNLKGSINSDVKSLAVPFGREHFNANFSSPVWVKRALPPPLDYGRAVCNGNKFWNMIQDAFNGNQSAGQVFTLNDADNGWTTDETPMRLPDRWDDPYEEMVKSAGDKLPDEVPVKGLRQVPLPYPQPVQSHPSE